MTCSWAPGRTFSSSCAGFDGVAAGTGRIFVRCATTGVDGLAAGDVIAGAGVAAVGVAETGGGDESTALAGGCGTVVLAVGGVAVGGVAVAARGGTVDDDAGTVTAALAADGATGGVDAGAAAGAVGAVAPTVGFASGRVSAFPDGIVCASEKAAMRR